MNTSAKITTGTFLAAMALGMASLVACTVTSTSSTDTDGGTSSSGGSSGGSSGTTSDAGDDGGETCDSTSQTTKYPAACQACTEAQCCDKIGACFNQQPDGGVGCNDYAECVSTCEEGTDDTCIETQCDAVVDPAVKTAFDILQKCQLDNCQTECFE